MTAPHEAGDLRPGRTPPAQQAGQAAGLAEGLSPAALPDLPDPELLRRHADGDAEAFGTLFRRHRDRLWAVALRTLGDPEEAADALQDAMISAFRRAGGFRGDSAVTTWLHRIVVNACLDRLRRRAARPVSAGLDEEALDAALREPQVPDPGGDSDTAMEVTAALRTLPAEQRAALVLVDMLGYPVADAAAALGISVGTVKSRCARGRARLLPRLAHLRGQPPPGDSGVPAHADGMRVAGTGPRRLPDPPRPGRNPGRPGCVSPAERGGDSQP